MGRSDRRQMASSFRFRFRETQRMMLVLIVGASVTPQAHLPSKTPHRSCKCARLSRQVSCSPCVLMLETCVVDDMFFRSGASAFLSSETRKMVSAVPFLQP